MERFQARQCEHRLRHGPLEGRIVFETASFAMLFLVEHILIRWILELNGKCEIRGTWNQRTSFDSPALLKSQSKYNKFVVYLINSEGSEISNTASNGANTERNTGESVGKRASDVNEVCTKILKVNVKCPNCTGMCPDDEALEMYRLSDSNAIYAKAYSIQLANLLNCNMLYLSNCDRGWRIK